MKKQQVHIDNISLSDCEIKAMSLNDDAHEINIIAKMPLESVIYIDSMKLK